MIALLLLTGCQEPGADTATATVPPVPLDDRGGTLYQELLSAEASSAAPAGAGATVVLSLIHI